MGSSAQSMVEIYNRHSFVVLGGNREFEQAKEAVGHASLRRIRVDCSGKEDYGLQRVGFSTYWEPSYVEANSNSGSDQEMRSATLLQRGYNGDPEILDGLETRLDNVQGFSKETRMEHDGCGDDES